MTDTPAPAAGDGPPPPGGPAGAVAAALGSGWRRFRTRPVALRLTVYVALALALTLVVLALTATVLVRRPLPQTSGTIEVAGLDGEVEVVRDEHGIAQLYADSMSDLARGQGYVHAQERFFEMDVRRHATAGRLAELFGEDAVESDAYVRTMGWRRVAEKEVALLTPDTRTFLEAYADGVNAYLDGRGTSSISLEYTVLRLGGLDYQPEDWTPVDSLAWLKAMAWDLRGNMDDEAERVLTADAVGEERAAQLFPGYPYGEVTPIVTQGAVVDQVYEQDAQQGQTRNPMRPAFDADQRTALRDLRDGLARMPAWLGRGEGLGSNSWVVDGDLTETGSPLLANDPHLGSSLPGVWMQMGLHCRDVSPACPLDVSGFTFSGVPGVIIGHNADIAWGFTNLGPDVTDLYVERVRGEDAVYDGEVRPLRIREEVIRVQGGQDVRITVRAGRHGPLVSDVADQLSDVAEAASRRPGSLVLGEEEAAVALKWTALEPGTTADAILALNLASDWDSFRAAASEFDAPAQNLVYADTAGRIGYQAPGRIPIRKSGNDGTVPSAGWLPENDWTGTFVPFDALPSVLDPEEGFLVTANQAVVDRSYPYFLTDDWDRGARSERLRELLTERLEAGPVTAADMLEMQLDTRNPMAPVLVPHLLGARLPEGYQDDGQRLLGDWDFTQPAEGEHSAAAAYYNVVWATLLDRVFDDELPEDLAADGGQRWMAVVTDLLDRPDDPWWDDVTTDEVEQRDDTIEVAMLAAADELVRRQARDADDWTWGHLHRLDLRSATLGESGVAVVEALFNRDGWGVGGGAAIVDATAWDAAEGYTVTAAPSMRMVTSPGDWDASRWINLTGVSGHPASSHYTDQTDLWARGETLPWLFGSGAVHDAGADTLTLRPASEG
ncbi:penicillin acylase family protein [Nocardioides dokdonensis]|nr:penicillin acylase family protein [Nocardioides dokdonensis]